jgi:hypothetical protein
MTAAIDIAKDIVLAIVLILVSGVMGAVIQRWCEKKRRLRWSVNTETVLTRKQTRDLSVGLRGKQIDGLYETEVILQNVGTDVLEQLPVTLRFEPLYYDDVDTQNDLYMVEHSLSPHELGRIATSYPDTNSIHFVYDVLNRKEVDRVTFLTAKEIKPSVYATLPGLTVVRRKRRRKEDVIILALLTLGMMLGLGMGWSIVVYSIPRLPPWGSFITIAVMVAVTAIYVLVLRYVFRDCEAESLKTT